MSSPSHRHHTPSRTVSAPALRRGVLLLAACAAVGGHAAQLRAQTAPPGDAARRASRRLVSLVAHPLIGDTLELVTEQRIEMGVLPKRDYDLPTPVAARENAREKPRAAMTHDAGPRRGARPPRVSLMRFYARSIVERVTDSGAILRSLPDSILLLADADSDAPPRAMALGALGEGLRLFVSPDGAMTVLEATDGAAPVGATLSGMPAMLPAAPVAVGQTWERDVPMPPLPYTAYRADGALHAVFRLDSLTRGGRMAWVSISGTLKRDGAGRGTEARALRRGTRIVTDGTINGWLVLDRDLGWITDARTVIEVDSDIVGTSPDEPPMHTALRITQRMRVR